MNKPQSIFILVVGYSRNSIAGQYLMGPLPSWMVRRSGYRFTTDTEGAWYFPSEKQARAKARIVARHMDWSEHELMIEETTLNPQPPVAQIQTDAPPATN